MSKRGDAELVEDIARIERYTSGTTYEAFIQDTLRQDAVVRNLGIIGEAVKRLSPEFRKKRPNIRWLDVAGMRDRLVHDYFGVNWTIVWDVIQAKLPELKAALPG